MVLVCASTFGGIFFYDGPSQVISLLEDYMRPDGVRADDAGWKAEYDRMYPLLYTVYSVPNIFLPMVTGTMMDRVGLRTSVFMLSMFCFVGGILVTLGIMMKAWWLMILGRLVFGFGGESLQVAQNSLTFRYFEGSELAFAS